MVHCFLPPIVIGGFEYIRHDLLLDYLSMETGNLYIAIITFILSYLFAEWVFRTINRIHKRLGEERAKRAVYEERERLAHELHDNIAQMLFFLNVKLKQAHMDEAKSVLAEIDSYLRQAIFNLRSSPEEGADLPNRLKKWLNEWCAVTGIHLNQEIQLPPHYFSQSEEVQLFGIIQEAFTNIRKHSGAGHADIVLYAAAGEWSLSIQDNGCGVEEDRLPTKKYGVSMMVKRASELGAVFELRKVDSGGTEVRVSAQKASKTKEK